MTGLAEVDAPPAGEGEPAIVPQRLVLVLPTTGEFDSRAYRIASTVAARGHSVTVMARAGDAALAAEIHPAGYRILRVPVDPVGALPLGGLIRRAWRRRRAGGSAVPVAAQRQGSPAAATRRSSLRARLGHGLGAIRRLVAIGLTVRSQMVAARRVAPAADLYHGMAYMGIPVALALRRGGDAAVVYDARDIYLEARNFARLPRPGPLVDGSGGAPLGPSIVACRHRQSRLRRRPGHPARSPASAHRDELLRSIPAARPAAAAVPRASRARGRRRVVLYHGGLFPERGIEQLIEAMPHPDGPISSSWATAPSDALPTWIAEAARRPAGSTSSRPCHLSSPRLGRGRRRRRDADPADDAEPSPHDAEQAVRGDGGRRSGRRLGPAGHGRDRPRDRLRRCSWTRPTRAAIAEAIRTILDAPDDGARGHGRAGRSGGRRDLQLGAQVAVLLAEYGRLTGRPW